MTEQEFIKKVLHKPWANRCETFEKMDCMGLVNLYYKHVLNVGCVKINGYETCADIQKLHDENINKYWYQVDDKKAGDMIVMLSDSESVPPHVGILLGCKLKVLHCNGSINRQGRVSIHKLANIAKKTKVKVYRLKNAKVNI